MYVRWLPRQTRKGLRAAQCRCIVGGNCVNIVTGAALLALGRKTGSRLANSPLESYCCLWVSTCASSVVIYVCVCVQRQGKHRKHHQEQWFFILFVEFNYFAINFICWYELLSPLNYPREFIEERTHNYSAHLCEMPHQKLHTPSKY